MTATLEQESKLIPPPDVVSDVLGKITEGLIPGSYKFKEGVMKECAVSDLQKLQSSSSLEEGIKQLQEPARDIAVIFQSGIKSDLLNSSDQNERLRIMQIALNTQKLREIHRFDNFLELSIDNETEIFSKRRNSKVEEKVSKLNSFLKMIDNTQQAIQA